MFEVLKDGLNIPYYKQLQIRIVDKCDDTRFKTFIGGNNNVKIPTYY